MSQVKGTIFAGKDRIPLKDCKLKLVDEIMRIERPCLIEERNESENRVPARSKH